MTHPSVPEHVCWVCNKPVKLETAKTDEQGGAVHEECYVMVCALNAATRSNLKSAT